MSIEITPLKSINTTNSMPQMAMLRPLADLCVTHHFQCMLPSVYHGCNLIGTCCPTCCPVGSRLVHCIPPPSCHPARCLPSDQSTTLIYVLSTSRHQSKARVCNWQYASKLCTRYCKPAYWPFRSRPTANFWKDSSHRPLVLEGGQRVRTPIGREKQIIACKACNTSVITAVFMLVLSSATTWS